MTDNLLPPKELLSLSRRLHPQQVKWRKHLHQYPELANQEFATTAYIKQQLGKFGLKILPLKMKTGVLAELKGSRPGQRVAIRSDIDALPLEEKTGLRYASKNMGKMHGCGHDLHMATVLGTAALLSEIRDRINGSIRFIFQPAEEDPPGGARYLVEEGAMKGVDTVFGLHVDPHLATGKIGLCDGPMMAMVFDFDLIIKGRGGHAARPQFTIDAITTAAEVVEALQKIVSRSAGPSTPLVITVGQVKAGTARNVIADRARLVCTARTLSPALGKKIGSLVRRTVGGVCRAHGATYEMITSPSYPMVINAAATNRRYAKVFGNLFGARRVTEVSPVLGGEDFAYYLHEAPGAMLRLGIRNRKIGADKPWHSSQFMVDDEAIYYGTSLLTAATIDYLGDTGK